MIIAFIFTEYQQNILLSIMKEMEINKIDILFIRERISKNKNLMSLSDKTVILDEIPYSWKNIKKYINSFKINLIKHIDLNVYYDIFSWSNEFPQIRLLLKELNNYSLNLLEDGAGSYINRKFNDFPLKDSLVNKLITFSMDIYSPKNFFKNIDKKTIGWSLYKGCYPSYNIIKKTIPHKHFFDITTNSIPIENNILIPSNQIVFIQQSYVEMTLMNEDEYLSIHISGLEKLKEKFNCSKVYWKLHPRTNFNDEIKRIKTIENKTNIQIEIIDKKYSMEEFVILHKEIDLKYISFGSSSLYVIPALLESNNCVFYLKEKFLLNRLKGQFEINKLYENIGVKQI